MAFAKQWIDALVDGTSKLLASKLNQLDTNVSRSVDGTAGGTYTPSPKIDIQGPDGLRVETLDIASTGGKITGVLATNGDSARLRRARTGDLGDAAAAVNQTRDVWVLDNALTTGRLYTLPAAASSTEGDEILFRRSAAATGAFNADIQRNPSGTIVQVTAASGWVLLRFHTEGAVTDWWPIAWGGAVTVLA